MLELFVVGTLWFWVLIIASVILLTYQVNVGNGWGSSVVFVLTILALAFLGNSKLFIGLLDYINENPGRVIFVFCSYFIAGAIWSLFKWYYFVLDIKEQQIKESKEDYNKKHGFKFEIPMPGDFKSDIILWMSYWPLSFIWTMIDNPFKRIFSRIFKNLENVYTRISNYIFKDVINEK